MSVMAVLAEILFVGHSLVGPDLPNMVEAGLRAMGEEVPVEAQVINGAPLVWNWDHSAEAEGVDGRAEIAAGDVTALILTEAQPVAGHVEWSDTTGQVARWAGLAREANPEVRVYLYETWPSLASAPGMVIEGDPGAGVPWRERLEADLPLWQAAAGDVAELIPAGQAMGMLADEIDAGRVPGVEGIADLFADDIHPNGKGLYFVAMVHLAVLAGKSPEGVPAKLLRVWPSRDAVISDEQAAAFQRVAWAAVKDYQARAAAGASGWVAPEMPAFQAVVNPALTLGLAGVNDWSVQQPFLDVMKTARPWVGHVNGQWGGVDEAALRAAGALSPEGWPLRIPDGVSGLSTLILTDLPSDAGGVAGRYVLTYQGQGDLRIDGLAKVVEVAPGRVVFDYAPGPGAVILSVAAVEAGDPIRDIGVVRMDRAGLLAAGGIFNPDWLARIRGVKGIRFMDWMATNDSTLSAAADRPLPGDYTWARNGVPVEVMVALANELGAEPWFTLPHLAEDGLVRAYADLVARDLDPGLRAWVEFSNEVWNPQFAQGRWANEQGLARWGVEGAGLQVYGLRAAEVMAVWTAVMPPARVVRVVATQTGVKGAEAQILETPLAVAEGTPAPAGAFDAYAVTGYFSGLLGAEHKLPDLRGWIAGSEAAAKKATAGMSVEEAGAFVAAHRFDLAIGLAASELRNGGATGKPEDTLEQLIGDTLPYHAQVAARYGMKLAMYEGGTHVVGYGPAVEDEVLTGFYTTLNFSPQMGALYGELLAGWAAVSDQPFNAFVDVYRPNKWGSWGALRHLWDENPRWLALAKGCDPC
jgi:hypothetical protein